jgi:hypothetical protein
MLVALPTLALSGGGCVEAESRFFISKFCPSLSVEDAECDEVSISDVSFAVGNVCNPATDLCEARLSAELVNRIVSSRESDSNNNDVETSDIVITGYDVRLNNGRGGEETFIFNTSGIILAEGDQGIARQDFQLIPPNEAAFGLLDDVRAGGEPVAGFAGIRFYGRTTGGLEVETPEAFLSITYFP